MSSASTTAANATLGFLTSEAASLLQQAKSYRDEMNKLAADDPQRDVYQKAIRDLVDRANRMSITVLSTSASISR
jgi:intergrase/recombinase